MFATHHLPQRRSLRLLPLALGILIGAPGCWTWHGPEPVPEPRDGGPDARETPRPDAALPFDGGAGPGCPPAESYFEPGCGSGESVRIERGCYQPCLGAGDPETCPTGTTCQRTDINPCICPPGGACCGACGAEAWLCLPPPPPPGPCEGRSYCDCTAAAGCEPLIDLTPGCVCPCDEPFSCGGPPCDCACGGARYLGCAPAGACATPELDCGGPGCSALVADGCPLCACEG